jgi:putative phage-type endonuclease
MSEALALQPQVLTSQPPGSPEWLELHKGRIGSNDIATVMGVSRFGRTKLRLWGELTGKLERQDISKRPEVRRGTLLEPVVIGLFEQETGRKVARSPGLVQHPSISYLAVTPDGITQDGLAAFEAKTVGMHARKNWRADVPLHVQIQGHAHMWVLGLARVSYAAFCLDADDDDLDEEDQVEDSLLLWADRERNDQLIETMGNDLVDFWENHVQKDIPPEPGADIEAVKALYKKHAPGKVVELAAALEVTIRTNAEAASERTRLKKIQDACKAEIGMAMADAEYGVTPGGIVVRMREEPRREHTVAACSPRVLRVVKAVGA